MSAHHSPSARSGKGSWQGMHSSHHFCVVGSAAIFIVLSGVDPAAIAVWRLGVTALIFLPFAARRFRSEISALSGKARLAMILAGVAFGLHFVLFNTGFQYTSYESTVVLIAAQPITAENLLYRPDLAGLSVFSTSTRTFH